jgi:hypothetical protein
MVVISIDGPEWLFGRFRIYVELAAEASDVRLPGRGDLYTWNPAADPEFSTAYDRCDDRWLP